MKKNKKKKVKKKKKARKILPKIKKKVKKKKKILGVKRKKNIQKKSVLKKKIKNNFIAKSVRVEENLKSKLNVKVKFDIFAIDRGISKFFNSIDGKINEFKSQRKDEKRRLKLIEIEKKDKEKKK